MSTQFTIIDQLFSQITHVPFAVEYWDEGKRNYGKGEPVFTIIFKEKAVIDDILHHVSLGFGENYTRGKIEVLGDFPRMCGLLFDKEIETIRPSLKQMMSIMWLRLSQKNTISQSRKNISHHYDLSNQFYQLMLDKRMIYSCAYFTDPKNTVDQAQEDKLEYICRKLLLEPGQSLLDIGCGWGALVIYAAQKYGVKATGITLSKNQLEEAQKRVKAAGLEKLVTLELIDYRELAIRNRTFDRIVSVGMMEHVGKDHIGDYMQTNKKLLKPNGIGLVHTIGKMKSGKIDDWMNKYIFPGAYLPEPGELIDAMRDVGMEAYLLENLRPHYAMTLTAWLANLEKNIDEISKIVSPETIQIYRLYLNGCIGAFTYGDISLYQISYSNGLPNNAGVPLTNKYLHA